MSQRERSDRPFDRLHPVEVDAIRSRQLAGEAVDVTAMDFDTTVAVVRLIAASPPLDEAGAHCSPGPDRTEPNKQLDGCAAGRPTNTTEGADA